ncbi:MAG TPA: putative selenate reductase subunit YgfK [Candidatus Atribacteria bacterium]|nr:putative selenate reductase subunit YgfK [Candidatus Atribacteria bacterium]HBY56316.1 putative selenate reductase subunit YgfK [Candidatus Atribacteria bacterium]
MGDIMRPISFKRLLYWITEEYRKQRTIFGIPESQFFKKENPKSIQIFNEICDTPIGPAAGPHTQLTQNIIAAYLVGGRFFELKTVQKLDSLQFDKPCIDARDEGYNTEWSTELSLEQAYSEYVKAWILLHFIESVLDIRATTKPSFIFNMSVGYDLEGIKTQRMDSFINGLIDASEQPVFKRYLEELDFFVQGTNFQEINNLKGNIENLKNISRTISPFITHSVTLSTMHGCPPLEIEAICKYLLTEKKLNTYVKLNPTLLGFRKVREILDNLGFDYISLKESTFTKDLQWNDAIGMLERLSKVATDCGCNFGVKLSNTLGTVNTLGVLPGEEMYLSGRILFPITITLASRLSKEFKGTLPISYSGGASQLNILQIFETGIKPITMATNLLKPGGYLRMVEMARKLEPIISGKRQLKIIDVKKLEKLAKEALGEKYYRKGWRGTKEICVDQKLPLIDCYTAPCVFSCPIRQDIPEYIRLAGSGQYNKALELIYSKNPLPHITGYICDHQCMYNCTRLDYEGAVNIREVKKIAAEQGEVTYNVKSYITGEQFNELDTKVAVIGAGPAGLSVAYFLAKAGFKVTVFEKQDSPGGVVSHILPNFRIPVSAIEKDIAIIKTLGVDFQFGVSEEFSINNLSKEGYKYIFIGIGAEVSRELKLACDNSNNYKALDFLRSFNKNAGALNLGRRVAIIGGGNTAVDSARAALKVDGVEKVFIIYRRTEEEMPADREEYEHALEEGIIFKSLLLPESFSQKGILKCRRMTLGEPDESGRRRPVPTEETEEIDVDSVISAIGEIPDIRFLTAQGIKLETGNKPYADPETLETNVKNVFIGGDAYRGPSTVVQSIADARKAAEAIIKKEMPGWKGLDKDFKLKFNKKQQISEIYRKKSRLIPEVISEDDRVITESEAERCLECKIICNKCMDVCPNRANVAIEIDKKEDFQDVFQILHLDALCNECGNCATFCPYDGKPYKDKLTLFTTKEDFENSTNNGFIAADYTDSQLITLRLNDNLWKLKLGKDGKLIPVDSQCPDDYNIKELKKASAIISTVLKDYNYLI